MLIIAMNRVLIMHDNIHNHVIMNIIVNPMQGQIQKAPLTRCTDFLNLLPCKIFCLGIFEYTYLLQVSMKKCGQSVKERRFLLLGKTEHQGVPTNSTMASRQSLACAKSTFAYASK